jgi:hypothetical protein
MTKPKLAFFLLCHKMPEHVIRLIDRLRDVDSFFVVHVDKRAERSVYDTLKEFSDKFPGQVYLCRKRYRCYWGRFGIVQGTLSCIRETMGQELPFDRAFLLSGQDYPIKSISHIRNFLSENAGYEFIESFAAEEPNRWSEAGGEYSAVNRVLFWTIFFRSRYIQIKWRRRFPLGFRPYCGSTWWCLTRECVNYLDTFVRDNPSFLRYFRTVFIPDEAFFQSILSNSPYRDKIVSDDLRYADWLNPNPMYPRTLETNDLERLMSSPKLFARKFDFRSQQLLALIDKKIERSPNDPPSNTKDDDSPGSLGITRTV